MDIAHLKQLAEAATPGPWRAYCRDNSSTFDRSRFLQWELEGPEVPSGRGEFFGEDACYIAALSPEVVLAMIACIEAADAMRARQIAAGYITGNDELRDAADYFDSARAALDKALD